MHIWILKQEMCVKLLLVKSGLTARCLRNFAPVNIKVAAGLAVTKKYAEAAGRERLFIMMEIIWQKSPGVSTREEGVCKTGG